MSSCSDGYKEMLVSDNCNILTVNRYSTDSSSGGHFFLIIYLAQYSVGSVFMFQQV